MARIPDTVRQTVRERARFCCEYCLKPEFLSVFEYHVDHIRPPMHGGTSEPHNLAWSCMDCNVHKGTNIASYDRETGNLTPLFDPRIQQWEDHFELRGDEIAGISPVGRVTTILLAMNNTQQVKVRRIVLDLQRRGLYQPPQGAFHL